MTFEKFRAVQTYNPRPNGGKVSRGVGYLLPHGALPGANARIAVVGSFVDVSATQTASSPSSGNVVQLLNGLLLAPCGDCVLPSRVADGSSKLAARFERNDGLFRRSVHLVSFG